MAGCFSCDIVSLGGEDIAFRDCSMAFVAAKVAGVASLGTGRGLFAAQIGSKLRQIVIIRVYFTVYDAAGVAFCPFMAVCGRVQRVVTDTAADRAYAVVPLVIFVRIFWLAAAAPFAMVSRVVAPILFIPYIRRVFGMRFGIEVSVRLAAKIADRMVDTGSLAACM